MNIVEFDQVSKSYKLGNQKTSLRETIADIPKTILNKNKREEKKQLFWALKNVSFAIKKEEVVGIIGHNGAGKSTILKLLSKVTYPTSGRINIEGRIAALIELGAGFHPDLSGRENIYLNASVLGLRKKDVDDQFQSIVEFSELERFIDTPIKRYSSGMYVRLAFAVATHIKADVLLVDEVLSVGDISFQQKSMAKMNELRNRGTTIIFVSHNLSDIRTFCDRVILLNKGEKIIEGKPAEVISTYQKLEQEQNKLNLELLKKKEMEESFFQITLGDKSPNYELTKIELINQKGEIIEEFNQNEPITIRCYFDFKKILLKSLSMIRVRRKSDQMVCFTSYNELSESFQFKGNGCFSITFPELRLAPGVYTLEANIHNYENWTEGAFSTPIIFVVNGRPTSEQNGPYEPAVGKTFLWYKNKNSREQKKYRYRCIYK